MMRAAILALALLAGCAAPRSMPDTPVQRAKAVVGASLVGTAPQKLMPAIADCVASAATPAELDRLQAAIDMAPNATTRRISRAIVRRTDTQACFARNGIAMAKG